MKGYAYTADPLTGTLEVNARLRGWINFLIILWMMAVGLYLFHNHPNPPEPLPENIGTERICLAKASRLSAQVGPELWTEDVPWRSYSECMAE